VSAPPIGPTRADPPARASTKPASKEVPATKPDSKLFDEADAAAIEDAVDHFFHDQPASDPTGKPKGKGKGKDKPKGKPPQ
jgi:hypothetical protein